MLLLLCVEYLGRRIVLRWWVTGTFSIYSTHAHVLLCASLLYKKHIFTYYSYN